MTSAVGGGAGFAGAAIGLKAVAAERDWIGKAVGAGKLALEPDAAENAAKHCEDEARELTKMLRDADMITRLSGLGDYPDGQELTQRFVDKASAGGTGAIPLLRQMISELESLARSYRDAARDYQATEEKITEDLQRGIQ
ncbi:hypothetical protein [Saccharopolyspora sp. CA-218241]|uniref:hypothetical protein n=1 Tax=Saccharopolyspora sp. CA-218241 TaxID=3240027 RepID=UPI003D996D0F